MTSDNNTSAIASLLELLQMERIEVNLFRAQNGPGRHVFGGQVLGQAIVAASRTVEDRNLHSIHGYFFEHVNATSDPLNSNTLHLAMFAEAKMQSCSEVALVTPPTVNFVNLDEVARDHFNTGSDTVAVGFGPSQLDFEPVVASARFVS